jgi:hypothetical protein
VDLSVPNSSVTIQTEAQLRYIEAVSDLEEWRFRLGATNKIFGGAATVGAGYLFSRTESSGDPQEFETENRTHQEISFRTSLGRVSASNRIRYEQRFREDRDLATRYRYRLQLTAPLNNPRVEPGTVSLKASAESFLNGAGRGSSPVFNRARLNAQIAYQITPAVDAALGYQEERYTDETLRQALFSVGIDLDL